ncbi:MAG: hypothetical protein JOZ81_01845 [Chloroflexi bacterium]|nr:hypothetical protein [Chloroflexota bacterium]MBV9547995.1 hypothetical protein [Chloroflexota bacterium]
MVQVHEQPQVTWELIEETPSRSRQLYLILYPKELEDEIIQALESTGVPGYTEFPKMIGRGRKVKHFDNSVWPGATGAVFTVVTAEEARQTLLPTFEALASTLEARSHGLYGLHMFALPCEQVI